MTPKAKKIFIMSILVVAAIVIAVVVIKRIVASRPFMYAGTLEVTKVIITARVPSDIGADFVAEGDIITKNQPLLELTCDAQKIMARQINNDFDRASALMRRGHVSVAELDVITRNKQDNDLRLRWCNVTSPIDGMVISKFRQVGEVVAPGTPLFALANPYDIWAYFYVPYDMLYRLHVGQTVTGILPEAPDKTFTGHVIKISEQAEFTPKNVQTRAERMRLVYGVKVRFDNPDLTLKSGMTIESTLTDEK